MQTTNQQSGDKRLLTPLETLRMDKTAFSVVSLERRGCRRQGILAAQSPKRDWKPSNSCDRCCMDMIPLPIDLKEFLKSLSDHHVEYLLIGGYAVAYHGYPRTTGDMDIWIGRVRRMRRRSSRLSRHSVSARPV